jgi:hypothetical protein
VGGSGRDFLWSETLFDLFFEARLRKTNQKASRSS